MFQRAIVFHFRLERIQASAAVKFCPPQLHVPVSAWAVENSWNHTANQTEKLNEKSHSLFILSSFGGFVFRRINSLVILTVSTSTGRHMDVAHGKKQGFGIFGIELVPVMWNTHCTSASGEAELLLSVKAGEEPARETAIGKRKLCLRTNQWWRGQNSLKIEIISNH